MLTKFQKNKILEMIAVLLPDYKYVRITRRGRVILKTSIWKLNRECFSFLDFCLVVLNPLVSEYKFQTKDASLIYYLGMWKSVNSGYTSQVIDFLYSEFSRLRGPTEQVSIEAHFEQLLKDQDFILVPQASPKLRILIMQSKTLKLIIALLVFAATAVAV